MHYLTGGIPDRHDGREHHLRGRNGPQIVEKAAARTKIRKEVIGKVSEDNRSRDAYLARAFSFIVPAARSMRVERRAKQCRSLEELIPVPAVHYPVSVPNADSVLRKDTIPPIRPREKDVNMVAGANERNGSRLQAERLSCVTELCDDVQDPLGIANRILAPYACQVQAGGSFSVKAFHMHTLV